MYLYVFRFVGIVTMPFGFDVGIVMIILSLYFIKRSEQLKHTLSCENFYKCEPDAIECHES